MKAILGLFGVVAIMAEVFATDYCSSKICKTGVTHIACHNNGKFAQSCPADAKMVTITEGLRKVLVNAHNAKRNKIAGGGDRRLKPACRMATMQWDDELAATAAFNVKQCHMIHDQCHNTDHFSRSGQNLAWRGYRGTANHTTKLREVVEMWYSEVDNITQSYIDSFDMNNSTPVIAHFTVMVADRNVRVGCAATTYTPPETHNEESIYLVACNYASTNMRGFPIYAKCDKPAMFCKTGKNPRYKNLCSLDEIYEIDKWERLPTVPPNKTNSHILEI